MNSFFKPSLTRSLFATALLATSLSLSSPASAMGIGIGGQGVSSAPTASDKVSVGTLSIIASPVASVDGVSGTGGGGPIEGSALALMGGAYVVSGIVQGIGDGVELTLQGIGSSAKMTIKLSGKAVKGASIAIGSSVQWVTNASGAILVASGKVIGFIPAPGAETLLSQEPLPMR